MPVMMILAMALAAQQIAAVDVAEAVASEYAGHDLNADGTLSRAEFGAWLAQLRAKGVTRVKVDAPETRTWVTAAFDQADTDHNGGVSQAELTAFLTTGLS